jgi:ABC-type dipeptide/oligopeptide/nickel transport system permease component
MPSIKKIYESKRLNDIIITIFILSFIIFILGSTEAPQRVNNIANQTGGSIFVLGYGE